MSACHQAGFAKSACGHVSEHRSPCLIDTLCLHRDDMLEDMRRSTDVASQRARAAEEAAAREKAQQSLNALNLSAGGPPPYPAAPHNYPPPQQVSSGVLLRLGNGFKSHSPPLL